MASRPRINLQWHITDKCGQSCRHCYLRGRNRNRADFPDDLPPEECYAIIDNFEASVERLGAIGSIDLTGGDPLLYGHIWDVLRYIRDKDLSVSILGNSYELNDSSAKMLKELGLRDYQISIDGIEENHDWLRKRGSFADSMRAFALLEKYDIQTGMMFTLTRKNKDDLLPVMRLAAQMRHHCFAFDVVSPTGKDDEIRDVMLSAQEFREVYLKYLMESERLAKKGYPTIFVRKNALHFLILEEENRFYPVKSDTYTIFSGCPIGKGLVVCADGRVLPCPRIPITIGYVPEDNMADIILHSEFLNKFRDRENFSKCSKCSLFQYCRGCRANAYALTGDSFAEDPYCWKKVDSNDDVNRSSRRKLHFGQDCRLSEEERNIMGVYAAWHFKERLKKSAVFQEIIGRVLRDVIFRNEIEQDIEGTCRKYNYRVSDVMLYELSRVEFGSYFNMLDGHNNGEGGKNERSKGKR